MALNYGKGNRSIAFAPTAAFPLNANSYFESYDLALAAALTAKPAGDTTTKYYFGQEIAVAEMVNNVPQSAKLYIIAPSVDEEGNIVGTLNEVGSATDGDGASIELVDGVLSIKDFGKSYYKYVAAVEGGAAAHYELTEGWVAGLEPRVVEADGKMVIGWYEPNPTTAEGVKDQVVEVQGQVDDVKEDLGTVKTDVKDLEDILNGTAEAPGLIEEVGDIADALYGTEGENPVPGLIDQVENLGDEIDGVAKDLADNYYTKAQTYNKTEIDGKISGLFHFKGVVDVLPEAGVDAGEVYQVGEEEYAWNGEEWVKLGYTIDLSSYYTKSEVDAEIAEVQGELDTAKSDIVDLQDADATLSDRIEEVAAEHETIYNRIDEVAAEHTTINNRIDEVAAEHTTINGRIDDLVEADTEHNNKFQTIDGKITALENANTTSTNNLTAVDGRLQVLEGYVGTPSGDLGALYPAVESLTSRVNEFEDTLEGQGFGEFNKLETLTINGLLLTPNASKNIDLPIFAGAAAGLVPVVAGAAVGSEDNYFLNAAGNWVVPADSRIGDLGGFSTVEEYVDNAVEQARIIWESI